MLLSRGLNAWFLLLSKKVTNLGGTMKKKLMVYYQNKQYHNFVPHTAVHGIILFQPYISIECTVYSVSQSKARIDFSL